MVRSRVRILVILGVVVALGAPSPDVSAQSEGPIYFDAIYFPWVPHNDTSDGAGPWYGSMTIQNIDVDEDNLGVRFWVFDSETINQIALNTDGAGGDYSLGDAIEDPDVPHFDLDPNASVTLDTGILGLAEPGSAVAVFALYKAALGAPGNFDQRAPTIAGVQKQAAPQPIGGARTGAGHLSVDGYSAIPFSDVAWGSQSEFCHMFRDGVDSCDGAGMGEGQSEFDGHSYLPIVQTNSGWNTKIYLSNVDFTNVTAAQANITLTRSNQQGASASEDHRITETVIVPPGGTAVVDAGTLVEEGWVGSARITSTVGISSLAVRSKPAENMMMINTSAPSLHATTGSEVPFEGLDLESDGDSMYQLYAPLVFRDYHGWNTGISLANIAEESNSVGVSFIGPGGNVITIDVRTIPPQSQEFIYIPAGNASHTGGVGREGYVGAVIFQATRPFHAAVDQVKYSTGEAMSYLATSVAAGTETDQALSIPLVQKGWTDGSGDTSGIQVFNPDADNSITFELRFFDSSGVAISPTAVQPLRVELSARRYATFHMAGISEMPQNQRASAVLTPVEGEGSIVGVSNNVNYAVSGDGSVAFNMVNLRGQYRVSSDGGSE